MKVQINVGDEIWCRAKAAAGLYRRTLGQVVEEALVNQLTSWELCPPMRSKPNHKSYKKRS
jgi:hypothetical protein